MLIQHTVHSFDNDLNYLEKKIDEMGISAKNIVTNGIKSVIQDDCIIAKKVIIEDLVLDQVERDIDEKAILIIARRQPMAVDLREIIGAIRISKNLERVGDMGKNIAKSAILISEIRKDFSFYFDLQSFSNLALQQLEEVLLSYNNRSLDLIDSIQSYDKKIHITYISLFQGVLQNIKQNPDKVFLYINLLFCIKNIERIGDHASNIANTIYYIITGTYPEFTRFTDEQYKEKN